MTLAKIVSEAELKQEELISKLELSTENMLILHEILEIERELTLSEEQPY